MDWITQLDNQGKVFHYVDLNKVGQTFQQDINSLPYSIRVLLESVARQQGPDITSENAAALVDWRHSNGVVPFKPARVILQDFTGVPAVVDLAAMRDAVERLGGSASEINPEIPVDLVVDHSVQVDCAGTPEALAFNTEKEFERNQERYRFLKWAQGSFENFEVVPPETGIIHQVNIERLSDVILQKELDDKTWLFPDTLQGTDSHTTMINGLGVLGWGVGGIEAEAAILGEASFFPIPEVIGVDLQGKLSPETTATDLALYVTEILRKEQVVGKFVEFFGEGYQTLSLSDRATIANMAPEYGATCGFFPVDEETLRYLTETGRSTEQIALVEAYTKVNHLFYDKTALPTYTKVIELDLKAVSPALSGPKRPQDRILLEHVKTSFETAVTAPAGPHGFDLPATELDKEAETSVGTLKTGDLVLAAITSCTNTSNPHVLVTAGLIAKKATELGLTVSKKIKTSLAPGSKVVTAYLEAGGLLDSLAHLGFEIVGYGCTTCIGNSGPLAEPIETAIKENDLLVTSVLSGNRNFEGRIHPLIKANYLASPPLVVAYALAGTISKDLTTDALGTASDGKPIYLKDLWPEEAEVRRYIQQYVKPEAYNTVYQDLFSANQRWNAIKSPDGAAYTWEASTYIANPPYFDDFTLDLPEVKPLKNLRVLAKLGDSVTTDHISPAGNIGLESPAGKYLQEKGVAYKDFNSFGSRRGNHEVMMRGTFGNIRLQNQLTPEIAGGYTKYLPTGETMSIYDAAMKYQADGADQIILAGKDYGMGSSRDWAAKGTQLLGVKVVLAESFERIHRSNLVMMGLIPLEYLPGENAAVLGLTGTESFTVDFPEEPQVGQLLSVTATAEDGSETTFRTRLRFDAEADIRYWRHQGILPMVIRKKMTGGTTDESK